MLSYKLAKQLKDAGFPQKHEYGITVFDTQRKYYFHISNSDDYDSTGKTPFKNNISSGLDDRYIYIPTLSELIEACGGMFRTVGRDRMENGNSWSDDNKIEKWEAVGWKEDPSIFSRNFGEYSAYGITPEEAVAKLWLKLNTRK